MEILYKSCCLLKVINSFPNDVQPGYYYLSHLAELLTCNHLIHGVPMLKCYNVCALY